MRCADCGRSRTELHSGDEALVCWLRESHGEKVDPDHHCGRFVPSGSHGVAADALRSPSEVVKMTNIEKLVAEEPEAVARALAAYDEGGWCCAHCAWLGGCENEPRECWEGVYEWMRQEAGE